MGLNPQEGFLLSRIDGCTTWGMLREIGGLSPEEVDLTLESWVGTGLVVLETPEERAPAPPPLAPAAPAAAEEKAENEPLPEPDPRLDLDVDLQREIFAFEAKLDRVGYHEILGVGRGADAREVKRAYFKLSKRYHPDRYFRREIGHCAERLDRIFKRVALAYELLSDPTTRAEIERSLAAAPPPEPAKPAPESAASGKPASSAKPAGYRAPTRMENLARLRRSFGGAGNAARGERQFRAGQLYEAAQAAAAGQRWSEAAASVRLAIAFDPWNAEYKTGFAVIQAEHQAQRALEVLAASEGSVDPIEALEALEEVICFKPADVGLQVRACELSVKAKRLDSADEYAERACELEPERVDLQLLRARVKRMAGDEAGARDALRCANKLSPDDPEIEAERARLRKLRAKSS